MRHFACAEPTWTHADREASPSFAVLPGGVVAVDDALADDWAARNTATELKAADAATAIATATKAGIAARIVELTAEKAVLSAKDSVKDADAIIAALAPEVK